MNDVTFNTIPTFEIPSPTISEVMSEISANISSISERIEHREAPASIEKTPETVPQGLQMAEDKLNEPASEELTSEVDSILNELRDTLGDKDGDGIPDGWDKNPGMTVADVAAFVLKLGKYADNYNQTSAMTKINSVAKSVKSLLTSLNKLSEQLANLEAYKNDSTRIQNMIKNIDPYNILAMDGGILG